MQRTALALSLATLLLAPPAAAQQYWLPNGPGGTTYNNPQGSLLGTMNEHLLQRHMQQRQMQQGQTQQGRQPGAAQPSQPGATGSSTAATARSADPSFRLNNTGGRTVREVYVSAAADNSWGADRLGAEVLAPGNRIIVRLPMGQCLNDIRVVFMDGKAQERRRVDTCGLTDIQVQ
ncbi:MAG TPA: hypothetical protein VGN83_22680 [Falsiroseomonas sp.]|jgi:hypothetical protein|nr:hypothetical protein [Falsiroseomonas sp.]